MTEALEVRESRPSDLPVLETLYSTAFPDEDLLQLLRDLLGEKSGVLSLVGLADNAVVGHVAFTLCNLVKRPEAIALLGPLAVTPERQRQGVGSALVRAGLSNIENSAALVCVLGDPAYYGRFGFTQEEHIAPPYPLPDAWQSAWQSLRLTQDAPPLSGTLIVPVPWRHQALWAPSD